MTRAAELIAEARRRGVEVVLQPGGIIEVYPISRLEPAFLDLLRRHRDEIRSYLEAGWPCSECGGSSGHTVRCPKGPGPAGAPDRDDVFRLAVLLEWPEVRIGRKTVTARRAAWESFLRRATAEERLAAFEALERYEASWREHAPTAAEAVR